MDADVAGSHRRAADDFLSSPGRSSAVILVIGVVVSVFLAVTQINEPTLSFVPKFFGTAHRAGAAGPWLLRQLEGFTVADPGRLAGDAVMSVPAAPATVGVGFNVARGAAAFAVARRAGRLRPDPGDGGGAAAAIRPRYPVHLQHLLRADDLAGGALHGQADGFLVVPTLAVDDDVVAAVAQRRRGAGHPARRLPGHGRGRAGHRVRSARLSSAAITRSASPCSPP